MSGVPCCLVEVFFLDKKIAAISDRLLWVVEGGILIVCVLDFLTKPIAVALVFLFTLFLMTVHHVVLIYWHN